MPEPAFDKKQQLEKIVSGLQPDEEVEAVLDMKGGGTGFLGITSKRIIVYDKSFLRKMKAIVSIPYSRASSLSMRSDTRA